MVWYNFARKWNYILRVSRTRLKNNRTPFHVESKDGKFEVIGAAGEMAARRYFGLKEELHLHFDGGTDMKFHGLRINVKATEYSLVKPRHFLQWPIEKDINCDVAVMTMVDLLNKRVAVIGFALQDELLVAPINHKRPYTCREIPIRDLHPIADLKCKSVTGKPYVRP